MVWSSTTPRRCEVAPGRTPTAASSRGGRCGAEAAEAASGGVALACLAGDLDKVAAILANETAPPSATGSPPDRQRSLAAARWPVARRLRQLRADRPDARQQHRATPEVRAQARACRPAATSGRAPQPRKPKAAIPQAQVLGGAGDPAGRTSAGRWIWQVAVMAGHQVVSVGVLAWIVPNCPPDARDRKPVLLQLCLSPLPGRFCPSHRLPFSVRRYFCRRLVGLSGTVISSNSASKAGRR